MKKLAKAWRIGSCQISDLKRSRQCFRMSFACRLQESDTFRPAEKEDNDLGGMSRLVEDNCAVEKWTGAGGETYFAI